MSATWAHVKPIVAKFLEWKMLVDEEDSVAKAGTRDANSNQNVVETISTANVANSSTAAVTARSHLSEHSTSHQDNTHIVKCFGIGTTGPCKHKKRLPIHEKFYLCNSHSAQAEWLRRHRRD